MEYVRDSLYLEEFVYSTPLPTLAFLTKETQQQLVAESIMARYVACSLYPNPSFRIGPLGQALHLPSLVSVASPVLSPIIQAPATMCYVHYSLSAHWLRAGL